MEDKENMELVFMKITIKGTIPLTPEAPKCSFPCYTRRRNCAGFSQQKTTRDKLIGFMFLHTFLSLEDLCK